MTLMEDTLPYIAVNGPASAYADKMALRAKSRFKYLIIPCDGP